MSETEKGPSELILAGIIFVVGASVAYYVIDPYNPKHAEIAAAEADERASWREAEAMLTKSREEGAKALDEADNAIRAEASERRARLEKASKAIKTTNSNGVRVDQYILKKGGIISCTTTISGNAPAIFKCDGDV